MPNLLTRPTFSAIRAAEKWLRIVRNQERLYGRARMRYRDFRHNLADMYRVMKVFNLRRAIGLAGF
jgi:hypothetical protein